MMQPNELRIGNWVVRKDRQSGKFICYEQVNYLKKSIKYGELPSSYCVGIPLTPEILEKCGFVTDGDSWVKNKIELMFITTDEHYEMEFTCPSMDWKIVPIKYLHQLQNLCFALTGKELTITL